MSTWLKPFWHRLRQLWDRPRRFFFGPDPEADPQAHPVARAARQWADSFDYADLEHGALVLDHAVRVYQELRAALDIQDRKAAGLLQAGAILISLLFAAIQGLHIVPGRLVYLAIALFLAATLIALWTLSPRPTSAAPSLRTVCEGLGELAGRSAQFWLAMGLHRAAEQLRIVVSWKAARNRWATWAITLGLACLALSILCC